MARAACWPFSLPLCWCALSSLPSAFRWAEKPPCAGRIQLVERLIADSGDHRSAVGRQKRCCGNNATPSQSGDFSFYKAVGEKNADAALTPPGLETRQPAANSQPQPRQLGRPRTRHAKTRARRLRLQRPQSGGYFVQVAAVSRQEDADALVEALKKKQYPAFDRQQSFGRQVLSRSGWTLCRHERRGSDAGSAHQRWVQSDCEKVGNEFVIGDLLILQT